MRMLWKRPSLRFLGLDRFLRSWTNRAAISSHIASDYAGPFHSTVFVLTDADLGVCNSNARSTGR